jgi:predicted RND superfamily exporter protein
VDRISGGIIKHKKAVVALFFAAMAVCAGLYLGVAVNYDLADYLPDDAPSTRALGVMKEEFGPGIPNARVMVKNVSVSEALAYKQKLADIDGVGSVLWLDDAVDIKTPLEMADSDIVEEYYKNGNAIISFSIGDGDEVRVTDGIYALVGDGNPLSGEANDRAWMQKLTSSEVANAMKILIPVIVAILILSTEFWLEPLLFLFAIGVSVVINMGTNIFFGEISFVSNSVSPILQLAVSLDYAIFLLHRFSDFRAQGLTPEDAMRAAVKRAFPTIAASAATTFFGFLALVFMDFGLGADLGLSLVKGIVFSFVSVVFFLPAFTLCVYKLVDKTKHRHLMPDDWPLLGRAIARIGIPIIIIVCVIGAPSFLAQNENSFTYGFGNLNQTGKSGLDTAEINREFGRETTAVLLVPKGEPAKEAALAAALAALPRVREVLSYTQAVGAQVPEEYLDKAISEQFYSGNYARIIVYADTPEEGELAFSLVDDVRGAAAAVYGDAYYALGQSVNLSDMEDIIKRDQQRVNIIALISIFLVLLIMFRSLALPFVLLLTIEAAIWINLAIPYFTGSSLSYIGYLVLSTVQLGATVDYAILLTDHYKENRRMLPVREARRKTLSETFGSILVSGAILSSAGFVLWASSSNPMVAEIGLLLGRGTLLSMCMVVFFLPSLLALLDRAIAKTTYKAGFLFRKITG